MAAECLVETNWSDGTGSWFVAANWDHGVPTTGIGAQINNGGTAQVNGPGAAACDLTIGFTTMQSGAVSVNGGSLTVLQEAEIGAQGKGKLILTNGGSANVGFLTIAALSSSSSSGTVSVNASSLTCTTPQGIYVGGDPGGPGGTGLLSVTNGGTVSAGNGSIYVFSSGTVSGNGTVSTTSETTINGTLAPNWTLTMAGNLAFVSVGGSTPTMQCNVTPSNVGSIDVDVSGGATLDGRVSVTMTGTFTPGTQFTLLHAAGGLGGSQFLFQSIIYPTGQGFTPKITYDAHNVYLYLIPNT